MAETKQAQKHKYIEKIGRRKEAVARVRITPSSKMTYVINERGLDEYFPIKETQEKIKQVFEVSALTDKFAVSAIIKGGGQSAQAQALILGIARALVASNIEAKTPLKKKRFLSRDARVIERKKFGLKKARKRPQWSKR